MEFATLEERNKFIEDNLKLIPFTFKRYCLSWSEDRYQTGCVALIRAVDTFVEDGQHSFIAYAIRGIKMAVLNYAVRQENKLIKPHTINWQFIMPDQPISLSCNAKGSKAHSSTDPDWDKTLGDAIGSREKTYEHIECKEVMSELKKQLTPQNFEILRMSSAGYKQEEIAERLKLSRVSVAEKLSKIRTRANRIMQGDFSCKKQVVRGNGIQCIKQ